MKFFLRRFLSRKQSLLGIAIVGLLFGVAAFAPLLSPPTNSRNPGPFKYIGEYRRGALPQPPTPGAPLGTSGNNLDVYHALVWGTRSALRFGLTVTIITALLGTLIGAISGYVGGIVEQILMMLTDAFLVFPPIAAVWLLWRVLFPGAFAVGELVDTPPFLAVVQTVLTWLQLDPVALAFILFLWPSYARLVNISVNQIKEIAFVEAARSLGATPNRILLRHVLPGAIPSAIVLAARDVSGMVILASAFTYIGFGGNVVWGWLLAAGKDYVIGVSGNPLTYWWVWLPASVALIVLSVGWNLLGDSLHSILSPRR